MYLFKIDVDVTKKIWNIKEGKIGKTAKKKNSILKSNQNFTCGLILAIHCRSFG